MIKGLDSSTSPDVDWEVQRTLIEEEMFVLSIPGYSDDL
jgi:hypothetical protein